MSKYNLLKKTIDCYGLKKIEPLSIGLGDKKGLTGMIEKRGASYISGDGSHQINLITIDNFVEERNLTVGLIKLDVEGYGLKVLKGAKKTIQTFKPILLISIYHNGEEFFDIKSYIENLNLEYQIIIRKLGASKPFTETNIIAW